MVNCELAGRIAVPFVAMQPRPQEPDWYEVLDVAPDADEAAIRAAHRKRARDIHPDVNPATDAHARMAELNQARDVLLDPAQRAAFDRSRGIARRYAGFASSFGVARSNARNREAGGSGDRMKFTFGRQRPDNWRDEDVAPAPRPSPADRAREMARWKFDRAAGPNQEDWYAFLGVKPWATDEEIRKAAAALAPQATGDHLNLEERYSRQAKLEMAGLTLVRRDLRAAYDAARPPWTPGPGPLSDYYKLLGIRPRATPEDVGAAVTEAHRALGNAWNAELKAKEAAIREAHWVLRDPRRRAAYDEARERNGRG